jgi:hypothetical protein
MLKKLKISKLAIVIFLTILIWVWADLALDENHPVYHATVVIGRASPKLLVSFPQGNSVDVNQIVLRGPASKINSIEQIINNDPRKLEFPLVIEQFGIDKPGLYKLSVEDIINKSGWIKQLGLSIKSCDPCEVSFNVVALTERELDVKCFDNRGLPISLETPQKVRMFVPEDSGNNARVVLSDDEIQRGIKQPIAVKPYIILPTGAPKYADTTVEIKLSPQITLLEQVKVQNAKIGYCLSENLLKGQCKIEIENMWEILNIEILATPAAKEAYESQWVQVELEIHDDDIGTTQKDGIVRREVYYRLPEDFVRLNQIKLAKDKVTARFKVTLLNPPAPS